jgi:hypothetical protein
MNLDRLILSPTGRPVMKFGDLTHAQFESKSYIVSIEWHHEARSCEPIMCIWSRSGGRDAGVFGICLSSIAKYADDSGNPTPAAFRECLRAMPTLGRTGLDIEIHELVDVILRHTPDLINCPPAPPDVRRAEAGEALLEITQKDQNGKTHSEVTV